MKHALHFASKLNSRDIQKCNLLILGTLLYMMLAKSVQSFLFEAQEEDVPRVPTFTSRIQVHGTACHKKVRSVLSEPKFGSPLHPESAPDLITMRINLPSPGLLC